MPIFLCEIHGRNAMLVVHNSFETIYSYKIKTKLCFLSQIHDQLI
jgi:hypothetical protein